MNADCCYHYISSDQLKMHLLLVEDVESYYYITRDREVRVKMTCVILTISGRMSRVIMGSFRFFTFNLISYRFVNIVVGVIRFEIVNFVSWRGFIVHLFNLLTVERERGWEKVWVKQGFFSDHLVAKNTSPLEALVDPLLIVPTLGVASLTVAAAF